MPSKPSARPKKERRLPARVKRSPLAVQRRWTRSYDNALQLHGDEELARRIANNALDRSFTKSGDRWFLKHRRPADARAPKGSPRRTRKRTPTLHIPDSREELRRRARALGITGFSRMTKTQLWRAVDREEHRKDVRRRRSETARSTKLVAPAQKPNAKRS